MTGNLAARRAVIRWAWRLFRREWRQQLLVLLLLTVAVGATVLGAAIATNTPPPAQQSYGTANHKALVPGGGPDLAGDLAAMRRHFGPLDVIVNQVVVTGTTGGASLRAQDPYGPYGGPLLRLMHGRYPAGRDQVALSPVLLRLYDKQVGQTWTAGGQTRRIVGEVEDPDNTADTFALVAPGQLSGPQTLVTVLFDATAAQVAGFPFAPGTRIQTPALSPAGISPAVIVMAFSVFALIFIGLVAVAGFTVVAQRRLRAIGLLSSLGATDRHVRLVLVANGLVTGLVAVILGGTAGFAAWFAYRPALESSAGHRIAALNLPWAVIVGGMALAVLTATLAARQPGKAVAGVPVVSALAGRPPAPQPVHRPLIPGAALLAAGLAAVSLGAPTQATAGSAPPVLLGIVLLTAGSLFFAPAAVASVGRLARWAPISMRLALRDLARYRSRSGAALSAISMTIILAVIVCLVATARYDNVLDYVGPTLPANQVLVYAAAPVAPPGSIRVQPSGQVAAGPAGSGPGRSAPPTLAAQRRQVGAMAAAIGTTDVVGLQQADVALIRSGGGPQSSASQIYVATPALLRHFGIAASSIGRGTDLLTSRPGLSGLSGLALSLGTADFGEGCSSTRCVAHPSIAYTRRLPTGTADPNLLVTESAVRRLHLGTQPAAWLLQTPRALTAAQINTVRTLAIGEQMSIQTANDQPSLDTLRNAAAVAALVLALGVLAMTVGLLRSEAGADLRTLDAAGAASRTRRTLTATTAATLALLGAVLGTAVAYVAVAAFYRHELGRTLAHVPVVDLLVLLVGLPLAGAVGGWLFSGRRPPDVARLP